MTERPNQRIVLAARPDGTPGAENFRLEDTPGVEPGDGEILLETRFLSLDPYLRGRMNDAASYVPPFELDAPLESGAVCRVTASRNDRFEVGDLVTGTGPWQRRHVADGSGWQKLPSDMQRPSLALGVLGMPGLTAWHGLTRIGHPRAGETVVVSAATGAVGSVVGQLARHGGARVVGIAGSDEKCRHAVETLGFDACVNHRATDFGTKLAAACPDGVDVYFENVGGDVQEAVFPLLNVGARVPLCGLIAHYNETEDPGGPDRLPRMLQTVLTRRIRIQGFIILDHWDELRRFQSEVAPLVEDGSIHYREDIVDGLENAPETFIGMLAGRNFGKTLICLDND